MAAYLVGEFASPETTTLQIALGLLLAGFVAALFFLWQMGKSTMQARRFLRRMAAGDSASASGVGGTLGALAQSAQERVARLQTSVRALTEERNRSEAILRSMAEAVAVVDSGERIAFCNEAFAKNWNITASSIPGKSAVEVIRIPELIGFIRRALQGEEGVHGEISLGEATRPQSFEISIAAVPAFEDDSGEAGRKSPANRAAVVVMHEITELRRLEQVRKDFVANVSHELRTPLTAIHGFAETLLAGALEDQANNRRFVEIIKDHSARLSRLTDDLLKLSRIEAGKLGLDFRAVDLHEVVRSEEQAAHAAAAKKGLSLSVEAPAATVGPVRGDARFLREVLRNLLDNAIQYTPNGGQIRVRAESNGHFAIITVADTGIGIPLADQSRIFERFYRVDDARSREVGGTGLGLAIAKHIVESHGGKIWVESAVGEGSAFHFSVPLAR